MLIVISSPVQIANEAHYINSLFNAGLEIFHLRKPESKMQEVKYLLEKIEEQYLPKIALHQHHHLAKDFGILRLHFTEYLRHETNSEALNKLVDEGFTLSTSIHKPETYYTLTNQFSYCFIGPVFNSISKKDYKVNPDLVSYSNKEISSSYPNLIAIGGIDENKIAEVKELGYNGMAVLGTIWNNPDQCLLTFKKLKALCT